MKALVPQRIACEQPAAMGGSLSATGDAALLWLTTERPRLAAAT